MFHAPDVSSHLWAIEAHRSEGRLERSDAHLTKPLTARFGFGWADLPRLRTLRSSFGFMPTRENAVTRETFSRGCSKGECRFDNKKRGAALTRRPTSIRTLNEPLNQNRTKCAGGTVAILIHVGILLGAVPY